MTAKTRLATASPFQPRLHPRRRASGRDACRQIRKHEGVLRAALKHDDTRPDRWTTFKGRASTARATPLLLPAMGKGREAAKTRSIAIGFQVVLGTLVNAILNDPGPLSIQDREMEVRLGHCLLLLLQAEMTPPATGASRQRKR